MNVPDWQLPAGVDRGLADYLRSEAMVAGYDAAMRESPLAAEDVSFCEQHFTKRGRILDLGTGTGRLCLHFAGKGCDCVGVDLSEAMLDQAKRNDLEMAVEWRVGNIVEMDDFETASFDYVACLFSTLGMVRGAEHRRRVVQNAFRLLKPGGTFVLHVHNRWHRALGWKRFRTSDHTMPQSYGGAPLTLHHFSKREATGLLRECGFTIHDVKAVSIAGAAGVPPYGYLFSAKRN